jgi:hypothetical protein
MFTQLLMLAAVAASPTMVDPLDETTGFFQLSPTAVVDVDDGKVILKKSEPASDAFARWGHPRHQAIPFGPDAGSRLEINVAELRGGATLQVRVQLIDADDGDLGYVPWIDGRDTPGTLVLEDLAALAAEHEVENAASFRLLFRHTGKPGGAIVLDEIRLLKSE